MGLTSEEKKQLDALLQPYRGHVRIQEMQQYIQHGMISTYEHVERVTEVCFWMNRRWNLGANELILVQGAYMHDFYLYDWHENDKSHRLHGYYHPKRSCENAITYFHVEEHVCQMILTHMWPLTITRMPQSKEAWILCLADKYVSLAETLFMRKSACYVD